jgi:hypothetical protein
VICVLCAVHSTLYFRMQHGTAMKITQFVLSNFFFFFENRAVCEIMWETYSGAGHRRQYGACSLHAG